MVNFGAIGHEPENAAEGDNFVSDAEGIAYGLIHSNTINIGRLGADPDASFQLGCTVVSVAPHPTKGLLVVGWQSKADVTRRRRKHRTDARRLWNYKAPVQQSVLLPEDQREYEILTGKGGMGQSMMLYSMSSSGVLVPWVKEATQYMRDYAGPNLLRV